MLQLSHYVLLSELGVTVEEFRCQSELVNGVVVVVVVCGWNGGELLYLAAGQVYAADQVTLCAMQRT